MHDNVLCKTINYQTEHEEEIASDLRSHRITKYIR